MKTLARSLKAHVSVTDETDETDYADYAASFCVVQTASTGLS